MSMTTLLFLMKFKSMIEPVNLFFTEKFSKNMLPLISISSVVVPIGPSDWPFANSISKLGASSTLTIMAGACCLILSNSLWAIALAYGSESLRASIVQLFLKSRGIQSISFFRFRTIVEDCGM